SLGARAFQSGVRQADLASPPVLDGGSHRARDIAYLFLKVTVLVEFLVARRIRLVIANEAIEPAFAAGLDQPHPVEPVGQGPTHLLRAGHIAMHDQSVDAP